MSFGLIPIWVGWKFYLQILKRIVGKTNQISDQNEPTSYRFTAAMGIFGIMFLVLFCQQSGMTLWAIGLFFVIYFPMVISITTRFRAEIGPPVHTLF